MKLFAGLDRTDYQDVLRAVGALIDQEGFREIRLWEHDDGLIIQGRRVADGNLSTYETYLLTDGDLENLLRRAYDQRGMVGQRVVEEFSMNPR